MLIMLPSQIQKQFRLFGLIFQNSSELRQTYVKEPKLQAAKILSRFMFLQYWRMLWELLFVRIWRDHSVHADLPQCHGNQPTETETPSCSTNPDIRHQPPPIVSEVTGS